METARVGSVNADVDRRATELWAQTGRPDGMYEDFCYLAQRELAMLSVRDKLAEDLQS